MGNIHTVGPNEALIVSGKKLFFFLHFHIELNELLKKKSVFVN